MSKTRLASALAGSVCVLAAAAWFVTNTFPLAAAPQVVNDSAGVTVDAGGGTLLHRSPVVYPEALRNRGVSGTVTLELTFDASGNVADARAVSGPEELRKPALQSALQWHFAHETSGNKRQVTISFVSTAPTETPRKQSATLSTNEALKTPARVLKEINVIGLPDDAKRELLSRLPVHVGDTITPDMMPAISKAAMEFDEHLRVMGRSPRDPDFFLTIIAPSASTPMPMVSVATTATPRIDPPGTPDRITVGGNVQSAKLIRQPRPVYPPEAKEARIQGVVKFSAIIGKDGTIQQLEVISGHPLLVAAALESVKQWVYETTLLNGNPVEVRTQIDVNFTLTQ